MAEPAGDGARAERLRFGSFELDRLSGELRKKGARVRLQDKPRRLLETFLEHPGVLVSRHDLQRRLWAADTFVDFDNGLNNAVARLRAALGDDAERPRFVETVGRRGYRFIAPVQKAGPAEPGPLTHLVVLPFRMLRSDPEIDFLAFSLADAVTAALSGLESLSVRSSIAAARFAGDAPDLAAIASALEVDLVLTGSIVRDGGELRVSTQLVEAPGGVLVWTHTSEVGPERVFQVQDELVRRIVESLALPLSLRERQSLRHDVPASGRAFRRYLEANRLSEDPETVERARDLYLAATAEDPSYAPTWARLARAYRFIAKFGQGDAGGSSARAEEAVTRALTLNPELSLGHHVYALLELESGRVRAALTRLLGRAREHRHDPDLFVALVQACRYGGQLDASLAADAHARRLDATVRTSVAHTHWMLGDLRRAVDEARRIGDPVLGLLLAAGGRTEDVVTWARRAECEYSRHAGALAYVRALAAFAEHDREASIAAAEAVLERTAYRDPEGLLYVAKLMLWNNAPARALDALSRAVGEGFACLPALDDDPEWEKLRTASRFGELRDEVARRHQDIMAAFGSADGHAVLATDGHQC